MCGTAKKSNRRSFDFGRPLRRAAFAQDDKKHAEAAHNKLTVKR
jgi:hypothetical protein